MIAYIYRKNPILLCCFYAFVIYINNKRGGLFFILQTVQAQKAAPFFAMLIMAVFLWVTDKTLEWALYDLILGWKKS